VVAHTTLFGVSDHPVCGAKVGFADFLLMPQPPLLFKEGNIATLPTQTAATVAPAGPPSSEHVVFRFRVSSS
jgi:hypothetical protein